MNRKVETKLVKQALQAAGFTATVKHGTGTAWGWLKIDAGNIPRAQGCYCGEPDAYGRRETCQLCQDLWLETDRRIIDIAMKTTGRKGDYDGRIGIQFGFA